MKKFQPDKLEPKSEKCVFVGYPKETVGYTFYHRSEGKTFVAKFGVFLEKEFLSKEVSGRNVELDEVIVPSPELESSSSQKSVSVIPTPISEEANDDDHETLDQVTTKPSRASRVRSAPEWYGNPILKVMLLEHDEPTNYEEAMMSPDSVKWLETMKSEMGSMYETKVWTLVDLPDDQWIFKKKTDVDGNVTVYEARLWQRVFPQVQGVDYDEIFPSVAMLKVCRNHVSISCIYEIWQMDVKNKFP